MIYGILLTIGITAVIVSRFFYGLYDITLGGDSKNDLRGGLAFFLDIGGTILVVYSVLNIIDKGVFL